MSYLVMQCCIQKRKVYPFIWILAKRIAITPTYKYKILSFRDEINFQFSFSQWAMKTTILHLGLFPSSVPWLSTSSKFLHYQSQFSTLPLPHSLPIHLRRSSPPSSSEFLSLWFSSEPSRSSLDSCSCLLLSPCFFSSTSSTSFRFCSISLAPCSALALFHRRNTFPPVNFSVPSSAIVFVRRWVES